MLLVDYFQLIAINPFAEREGATIVEAKLVLMVLVSELMLATVAHRLTVLSSTNTLPDIYYKMRGCMRVFSHGFTDTKQPVALSFKSFNNLYSLLLRHSDHYPEGDTDWDSSHPLYGFKHKLLNM